MGLKITFELPVDSIRKLCERYHVRELSLFGSAVREDFKPESDVDLLVAFQPDAKIGLMDLAGMQIDFSALLRRKVDIVPVDGLKPLIRDSVLASAHVIYAE